MRWQDIDQQPCSLARTLAIIGDNWTLLVLRDSEELGRIVAGTSEADIKALMEKGL